ncbi:MAG: 3-hydroxyacyl-CoA dehydrogenase family protein [Solirubrobacteraceae bacterium]
MQERLGIAGAGTIACGLATAAARNGEVLLWARSEESAQRARATVAKTLAKAADGPHDPDRVQIVTDLDALSEATFLVEAIIEHHGQKAAMLTDLGELSHHTGSGAVLATTTSSLSIAELARASGHPERFVGLHVFNPVPRMELIELVFPPEADEPTRARAWALCEALDKRPVEVPDIPGFVVNRLLFPYLFNAVVLMSETGIAAKDVDECMKMGAGMPMGPLALLDYVGLDVAQAIGIALHIDVPERLSRLVLDGALGRKSGRGFYAYDR